MRMTEFEKLNVKSSQLGFGCMRLPLLNGVVDMEKAQKMVDYAIENGITYFDTAYTYLKGESEEFLGEALQKYPRESYLLATKMPSWLINTREDMEKIFNEQLERLQTNYFDFYLIHSINLERYKKCVKIELLKFLEEKKAEGKIKFIGFSFHDRWENYEEIIDGYSWDFAQIQTNYIDDRIMGSDKLYKMLEEREIPCVVMEPLRGGFLSNLSDEIAKPFIEADSKKSYSSWALRWVAQLPNVKVVLSGMSEMEQMVENIETLSGNFELSTEESCVVEKVVDNLVSLSTIPCTGCKYCMPCFRGVDIPRIFKIYNDYKMFGNAWRTYSEYYGYFNEESKPHMCVTCNSCVEKCPQHIDIPTMLQVVDSELSALKIRFANDPRTKTSL
ncbi:MAG: aldo/keto reductase [Oscillospiraceae bacterium]